MPALLFSPRRSLDRPRSPVATFESATAEVLAEPRRLPERATLYVLAALVVGVIVFCSVTQIDRIVTAPGRLLPISGTLTVQPLEKSIINHVLVSVGDVVKKGQVLATCDPTFAEADLTQTRQKIDSLRAQIARMEAEDAGKPMPAEKHNDYDLLQASIWEQRRIEFEAGVRDYDQRINSTQAIIAGLQRGMPDLEARLEIAKKLEAMNADLVANGYVSQLEYLTAQDQRAQADAQLEQSKSSLDSSTHLLESTKQLRNAFIDKWHEDNLNNLAKARDDLDAAEQEAEKLQKVDELVNLVSPEDAIVVRVPNLSKGAIATEAQPLFSLVPVDAPLEVGVEIDAKDIGFVKIGDQVLIKFDAYKFLEHGTGTGVVKTISQDSFTQLPSQDEVTSLGGGGETRPPFFVARVKITSIKLHDVPANFRISPGMTIQSDIIVGRRTIMWYLLGGALRSGAEAMHEP
jgi:HlyD family type I secretion membrane fusion protein